ncbi:MAG: hypothetical protein ACPIOQ_81360 [Promethearchaeia archaeon]
MGNRVARPDFVVAPQSGQRLSVSFFPTGMPTTSPALLHNHQITADQTKGNLFAAPSARFAPFRAGTRPAVLQPLQQVPKLFQRWCPSTVPASFFRLQYTSRGFDDD